MTTSLHAALLEQVIRLPTDYQSYGGQVERWAADALRYPDCSSGCRFWVLLEGKLGYDWGICTKLDGPRFALLTFEHQAGFQSFEYERDATRDQEDCR